MRQTGVLKHLLFLRCRASELAIGGSRLSLNNLIDCDSCFTESVEILALSIVSQYDKPGKIIHMVRL